MEERDGDNLPLARSPQPQVSPVTLAFSVVARSQVQPPAGRAPILSVSNQLFVLDNGQYAFLGMRKGLLTTATAGACDLVLGSRFLAIAVQSALLPTRAGCFGSTDASFARAAAAA